MTREWFSRNVPFEFGMDVSAGNPSVFLKEGDIIPCNCPCGMTYTPDEGTANSQCPRCEQMNDHNSQQWQSVEIGL